jgi:hypothetical protein
MPHDTQTQYPGIIIRMKSANESVVYPTLVTQALAQIAMFPTGNKLLTGITALANKAQFGYTVCIMRADMTYDPCFKVKIEKLTGDEYYKVGWKGTNVATRGNENYAITPGVGSVTAIKYNPNMIDTPDGKRPSWVALAHELIHAYYNLKGKALPSGKVQNVYGLVEQEEMATVGLGGYGRSVTENKIRAEAHLPTRTTYGGL